MKGPGQNVAMGAAVLAKHPPAKIPFRPSFTVAVNGQSQVFPENGPPPRFTVTPAEDLRIDVDMVVPAHHKVTALWLGISGVVMGPPSDRALPVNASSDSIPAGQHPENVVVRSWDELPTFRFSSVADVLVSVVATAWAAADVCLDGGGCRMGLQ